MIEKAPAMPIARLSAADRTLLRELARRVAEIAADPVHEEKLRMWRRHNALQRERPIVLVYPEGSWEEILPPRSLALADPVWRETEQQLRRLIYRWEHLRDDTVILPRVQVAQVCRENSWGLEVRHAASPDARGAWGFEPVIKDPALPGQPARSGRRLPDGDRRIARLRLRRDPCTLAGQVGRVQRPGLLRGLARYALGVRPPVPDPNPRSIRPERLRLLRTAGPKARVCEADPPVAAGVDQSLGGCAAVGGGFVMMPVCWIEPQAPDTFE